MPNPPWEIYHGFLLYYHSPPCLSQGAALRPGFRRRRFLRLTGPLGRRVLRFDSGLAAEGCGIAAFGGDDYKVSVTELVFVSPTSQGKEPELPFQGRGYILPRSGHQNPHGRRPCQTLEPSGQKPRQSLEPSRLQGVSTLYSPWLVPEFSTSGMGWAEMFTFLKVLQSKFLFPSARARSAIC